MAAVICNRNICFNKSNFSFFLEFFHSVFTFVTSKNNNDIFAGEKFFSCGETDPFGSTCYNHDPIHKKIPLSYCIVYFITIFYNKIRSFGLWKIFIGH